ncbi:hypothetical protein J4E91_007974 [Alternaria rosae]|nr:hypothetical protein J4E91_007974 [Alternaria rosae]
MSRPSVRPHLPSPLRPLAAPSLVFKSGDLNPLHLDRTRLNLAFHNEKNENVAWSNMNSTEKHHLKKGENHHHNVGNKYNSGQHKRSGRQHARKLSIKQTITAPGYDQSPTLSASQASSSPEVSPNDRDKAGKSSCSINYRSKSPRLNGADLYVVRLGWQSAPKMCCEEPDEDTATLPPSRHPTGSLHDELTSPEPAKPARTKQSPSPAKDEKQSTVLASRPCYRCILYMASVGIKRVFWTDDKGGWEGAKVRDLVDALDNMGSQSPTDASVALNSVFVTKHEVLILRRIMGDS